MGNKYQVVIIQKGRSLPDGLREALQAKGYSTRVYYSENDIKSGEINHEHTIIVMYCAEGSCKDAVQSLSYAKHLHSFPIVLIGEDADKYESFLNRHFSLATTITTPSTSSDVLAAIEYIVRYTERAKARQDKDDSKESRPTLEAEIAAQQAQAILQGMPSIPQVVFEQMQKLGILNKDLGGARYAVAIKAERPDYKPYLSSNGKVAMFASSVIRELSDARVGHLFRTAMLSDLLFEALQLQGPLRENGKIAAALYSSSFVLQHRDISIKEYISSANEGLRKDLCSRIKDAAMDLASSGQVPEVSQVVATLARLIGQEELPADNEISIVASCIMASDLIDRFLFQQGVFNSVAAYCLLAKFKSDAVSEIHPLVLGCLIKIVAEAITSSVSALSMPKKLQKLAEAKQAAMQEPLRHNESKIPVSSLSPGMHLARPLTTWDGKELIADTLVLDEDLIWRLWQLAAIRPVSGPVVVNSEN